MSSSKIIRSDNTPEAGVADLPLDAKNMPPAYPNRPRGGLVWLTSGAASSAAKRVSEFDRRQKEAEKIIDHARTQSQRIEREAYHQGFEQGEAAGRKLAVQKIEPILKSLQTLLNSVSELKAKLIESHETELIRVAFLIATHVLHYEISANDEAVLGAVRAALSKVIKTDRIKLLVSPYDMKLIQQQMGEAEMPPDWMSANLELEADFNIGRGGCKAVTDSGEIDATIESQIRSLKSILWNE